MSPALAAVILIRLDARMNHQVTVADLAAHIGMGADTIRQTLLELEGQGQLMLLRSADGVVQSACVQANHYPSTMGQP